MNDQRFLVNPRALPAYHAVTAAERSGSWPYYSVILTIPVRRLHVARSRGSVRVIRGGSWNNNGVNCTASNRNSNEPGNANNNLGFRLLAAPLEMQGQTPRNRPPSRSSAAGGRQNTSRIARRW